MTVSSRQVEAAVERVKDAGLAGQVDIRLQDYRDVDDGPFDAISSIGMFEHVGRKRLGEYFSHLRELLRPAGTAAQPRHLPSGPRRRRLAGHAAGGAVVQAHVHQPLRLPRR